MVINIFIGFLLGGLIALVVYLFANKNQKIILQENLSLKEENSRLQQDISQRQESLMQAAVERERLEAELRQSAENLALQKNELAEMKQDLNKEFQLLANKIFEEKTQKFSQINEEKISTILNPLKENISKFEKKVEDAYAQETREKASLREQIRQITEINRQMSDDAQRLTMALKGDKKLQGNWGEMQLEQLLQYAGLQEGTHYSKQSSILSESGERQIPDYIVHMPESKHYIIDSKVSLVSYERYFSADGDDEAQASALKDLIRDLKNHIDTLSRKSYQNLIASSPDFVFMFVALEPALILAMKSDSQLFNYAFQKNIILVSTSTLLATLRTVSFVWTQENQRQNVLEIAKLGGDMYDKFVLFSENMIKVGNQINNAKETYQAAMRQLTKTNTDGSYHGSTIIGMAERMRKLGASAKKQMPANLLNRALEEEGRDEVN